MLIIPAIDIKNGQCVRLSQGQMNKQTIYSQDPLAMAEKWVNAGAKRLHIVDLDGALAGKPMNATMIYRIAKAYPDIPIQVGGGVRSKDTIHAYLDAGVSYIIIGTRAITVPEFVIDSCLEFKNQIIIGLDAKDGQLATNGWSTLSHYNLIEIAQRFTKANAAAIIFTDISRDGMLSSVNVKATIDLCSQVSLPVIASGGISDMNDIRILCASSKKGILGAITGRAIYEGTLDFTKAQQYADNICALSN